jgi:hypothetical protein
MITMTRTCRLIVRVMEKFFRRCLISPDCTSSLFSSFLVEHITSPSIDVRLSNLRRLDTLIFSGRSGQDVVNRFRPGSEY